MGCVLYIDETSGDHLRELQVKTMGKSTPVILKVVAVANGYIYGRLRELSIRGLK